MRVTEPELLDLIATEAIIDRPLLVRESLIEDLGISSMDIMTTLFELEERYDVVLEGAEMPVIKTVGDLTDFLLGRINGEQAA